MLPFYVYFRIAKLVSRDFDTRKIFYDAITNFGSGMKIDVDTIVNAQILSDYYRHLERGDEELKIYQIADIVGVIDDTLVLSNDVSNCCDYFHLVNIFLSQINGRNCQINPSRTLMYYL